MPRKKYTSCFDFTRATASQYITCTLRAMGYETNNVCCRWVRRRVAGAKAHIEAGHTHARPCMPTRARSFVPWATQRTGHSVSHGLLLIAARIRDALSSLVRGIHLASWLRHNIPRPRQACSSLRTKESAGSVMVHNCKRDPNIWLCQG